MCLSLMFALWFATGSVLLFVPFPSLSRADRLQHLPWLRVADIRAPPAAAIASSELSSVSALRIIQGPDAPLYVIEDGNGRTEAVDGVSGRRLAGIGEAGAARLAAAFSGRAVRDAVGPFAYDQWTVHQQFDPLRPFWRIDLRGAGAIEITVSARTGDIVQRTNRAQRCWNYVGAVIHWIYPTFIRRSFAFWDRLVWCVSLVGVSLGVTGMTLGIVRARRSLGSARKPTLSAFKGLFRWHHLAGLSAGGFLLTWIFSGWLSMDHGRLFSTGQPTPDERAAYRGLKLEDAAARLPLAALARLGPARQISLVTVGGRAFLVGETGGGDAPSIEEVPAGAHKVLRRIPDAVLHVAVRAAWPAVAIRSVRPVAADDAYEHIVTEPDGGPLTRIVLADRAATWVEIEDGTGQIKTLLDRSRRIYRWVYYGMHTFDLPFLSSHDTLRKTLILCLLLCGEGLILTGLMLGVKKLRRIRSKRWAAVRCLRPGPLVQPHHPTKDHP